jgi:hypothetical protein
MKNKLTPLRTIAVGLGLATALMVTGHIWPVGHEAARAQTPIVVGYDMNTAGNECPNNGTDCSVGPIDACVSVNPGDSFQFDVFMQGLPKGEAIAGWDSKMLWGPPDWLDITERTHVSTSVNVLVQVPGSQVLDLSPQELPVVSSPLIIAVVDMALPIARYDEANPPYTQGVLGRYTGQVSADTEPGLYALTFDAAWLSLTNTTPQNLCEIYGCEPLDGNHAPQYGLVAVGQDCPAGPTTPEPGAEGSPAATAAPTETAVAAATTGPAITPTPAHGATATPGPAGTSTFTTAATSSHDNDGTDWGSPVLIVLYVVAALVGGLAVAGIAYLGRRRRV